MTSQTETKNKVLNGLFWKIMENGGAQGVQFLVSIFLARMLNPAEYGVVAIITIFITIANVIVQNGFGTALIQKKQADEVDFSSVFYLNLLVAAGIYGILFFVAPYIAHFYQNPQMTAIVRVLSIILLPGAVTSVQTAFVSRKMEFRGLFLATLGASVLSGIVSIVMAYRGLGVWALAGQQISYYFGLMMILFITVSWKPQLLFSLGRLKLMFSFGWKLLCASLLDTVFNNIQGLVMGKIYNEETLGYYNRGEQFPKLIVTNLGAAIQSVMLPALSANQSDPERIKSMLRRSIMTSSYLILPMMAGMIAVADKLVLALLGPRWSGSVIFLQIMCIAYSFWPIHIVNLQALNAIGRSDIFLRLEIIKKSIGIVVLLIGIQYNAVVMVALKAAADFLCTFINAWPNKRLLNYSIFEQWKDILPSVLLSVVMGAVVYGIGFLVPGVWGCLLLQIVSGVILYGVLSRMIKPEVFCYLWDTLKVRFQTK